MEKKEIVFQKPAKRVQVFRQINEYTKAQKSFTGRNEKLQWRQISSPNGSLSNGRLYLPSSILADKRLGNCDLITIEDAAAIFPSRNGKLLTVNREKEIITVLICTIAAVTKFSGFRIKTLYILP